jgi:hypothetical protein
VWRLASIGALAAAAVALYVAPAFASPGIQYGIQDDAWIQDGPGSLEHRLDFVKALGVTTFALAFTGRRCADAGLRAARLERSGVSLGRRRPDPPGTARTGDPRRS